MEEATFWLNFLDVGLHFLHLGLDFLHLRLDCLTLGLEQVGTPRWLWCVLVCLDFGME